MPKPLYHAPVDCPVCANELITIRKGCLHCGTEIAGEFASCEFCALTEAELTLLKVFLASRGNVREVEKHLQVSYPTARARLDAILGKLGLDPADPTAQASGAGVEPDGIEEQSEYGDALPDEPLASEPVEDDEKGSAEEQILARVARGELSPDLAAALLADD